MNSSKPPFDPARSDAIRAMLVETARTEPERRTFRKRIGILTGLVVAAVLISGSGVAVALTGVPFTIAAPEPTPTSTPTATPTPTSTPTPAPPAPEPVPTPTIDPADPSTWIITFDGLGPISYGSTMADATAAMDRTDYSVTEPTETCDIVSRFIPGDDSEIIRITVYPSWDSQQTDAGIDVFGISSDNPDAAMYTPRTAEGIGLGSSVDDILAAYPGITSGDGRSVGIPYSITDGNGRWLTFAVSFETGLVRFIKLGQSPLIPNGTCD
jgi:hypothetical protein